MRRWSLTLVALVALVTLAAPACGARPTPATAPAAPPGASATAAAPAPKTTEWEQPAGDVRLAAHARGGRDGGPALIVIHGGPGLSHEYAAPLDALATAELRVIGFDARGTGRSSTPRIDAFGLEHHVDDVEVLRVGQDAARVHLLGHGWGGLVAMAYASKHPDRVASLVLVDAMPPKRAQWIAAQPRFAARQKQLEGEGLVPVTKPPPSGADCAPRAIAIQPVFYADPRHPAAKGIGGASCRAGVLEVTLMGTGDWDLAKELRALGVDALVIDGAQDPYGVEVGDSIVAALPRARRVTLAASGYYPWIEQPTRFFAEVRAFLSAHGP